MFFFSVPAVCQPAHVDGLIVLSLRSLQESFRGWHKWFVLVIVVKVGGEAEMQLHFHESEWEFLQNKTSHPNYHTACDLAWLESSDRGVCVCVYVCVCVAAKGCFMLVCEMWWS